MSLLRNKMPTNKSWLHIGSIIALLLIASSAFSGPGGLQERAYFESLRRAEALLAERVMVQSEIEAATVLFAEAEGVAVTAAERTAAMNAMRSSRLAFYLRLVGYPALIAGGSFYAYDTHQDANISREKLKELEQWTWLDGQLTQLRRAQGPIWIHQFKKRTGRLPNAAEIELRYTSIYNFPKNEQKAMQAAMSWHAQPTALPGLKAAVQQRSVSLQQQNPSEQDKTTVSVGIAVDEKGDLQWIIGTNEPNMPGWLIDILEDTDHWVHAGEESQYKSNTGTKADHHAEARVVREAKRQGWNLLTVGAGRPHCDDCWRLLTDEGVAPAGQPPQLAPTGLKVE